MSFPYPLTDFVTECRKLCAKDYFNNDMSHLYRKAEIGRQSWNLLPVYLFLPLSIYLSRMESCLWWWSCYNNSLAQRPISHRIHRFLVNDVSAASTTAVANLIGCVSISCASGHGFLSSGLARPIEVFKLVPDAPRLELRSHAQVRTQVRTQARARTYS